MLKQAIACIMLVFLVCSNISISGENEEKPAIGGDISLGKDSSMGSCFSFGHVTSTRDLHLIKEIHQKWNAISLPFNQSIEKIDIFVYFNEQYYEWQNAVNANIVVDAIFGWNRFYQYYTYDFILNPGQGYWVYALQNCSLWANITNITQDNYISQLEHNWNGIGIPFNHQINLTDIIVFHDESYYTWDEAVDNNIISPIVFQWDSIWQIYIIIEVLKPGFAYWMYSYQPCTLKKS
jgi:hypothetical protein